MPFGYAKKRRPMVKPSSQPVKVAKLARDVRQVKKKLATVETKHYDPVWTTDLGLATQALHLTNIAEGDGDSNRTGRQVAITGIQLKPRFVTLTDSNASFRLVVLQNLQQVADQSPALSDYLSNDLAVNSFTAWSYSKRYRCLLDKTVVLNVSFLNQDQVAERNYFINLKNRPIKVLFNGATGTDIQKNGIYAFLLARVASSTSANNGAADAHDLYANTFIRVLFTDM